MSAPSAALRAIKRAVNAGQWRPDPHLLKQLRKRGLSLTDVLAAIANAKRIEAHDMRPLNAEGESWRLYGCDLDGRLLGVGVELVRDENDDFVVVITVFLKERRT